MQRKFVPSNQTRGLRQVTSFPITADNQQFTIDLPRGPHLEYCAVRVVGSITNTVAWAGGQRSFGAYHYLRNAQWMLNSNVTLDSRSGTQIALGYFTRRMIPGMSAPATAAAPTTFEATFFLDRCVQDMKRPKDSYLKTDVGVSNNQLRLQFGALADMFQAGAGAATYTSVTASVYVQDYQEDRDAKGDTPMPLFLSKWTGQRVSLPNAGALQQVRLNTGNRLRAIGLIALNSTSLEPSSAVLTRVAVRRAGDQRVAMNAGDLRTMNASQYGAAQFGGTYIIDFANPGSGMGALYSEFWPIPSSADTYLELDTATAGAFDLVTVEGVDLVRA